VGYAAQSAWIKAASLRDNVRFAEAVAAAPRPADGAAPGESLCRAPYDALMMRRARHLLATAPQ
jgi:hypothetical protein